MKTIQLKIVSDGTNDGTKVTDVDGNEVNNVTRIVIIGDAANGLSAAVQFSNIPVELEGKFEVIEPQPTIITPQIIKGL